MLDTFLTILRAIWEPSTAFWAILLAIVSFLVTRWRDNKLIKAGIRNNVVSIHEDLEFLWERIDNARKAAKDTPQPIEETTMREIATKLEENLSFFERIIQKLGNYIRFSYGEKDQYRGRLESKWIQMGSSGAIQRRPERKEWPWTLRIPEGFAEFQISTQQVPDLGEHHSEKGEEDEDDEDDTPISRPPAA